MYAKVTHTHTLTQWVYRHGVGQSQADEQGQRLANAITVEQVFLFSTNNANCCQKTISFDIISYLIFFIFQM